MKRIVYLYSLATMTFDNQIYSSLWYLLIYNYGSWRQFNFGTAGSRLRLRNTGTSILEHLMQHIEFFFVPTSVLPLNWWTMFGFLGLIAGLNFMFFIGDFQYLKRKKTVPEYWIFSDYLFLLLSPFPKPLFSFVFLYRKQPTSTLRPVVRTPPASLSCRSSSNNSSFNSFISNSSNRYNRYSSSRPLHATSFRYGIYSSSLHLSHKFFFLFSCSARCLLNARGFHDFTFLDHIRLSIFCLNLF